MKVITYLVGDYSGPEHLEKVLTSVQFGPKLHAFQMVWNHLHKSVSPENEKEDDCSDQLTHNTNTLSRW